MKATATSLVTLLLLTVLAGTITSCEERKGPAEEIGEAIDDATDRRPAEGIRDAVENAADNVEDAVKNN